MKVVAVMPAFQEEPRIAEAVFGVKQLISTVIVVDDGSTDQTGQKAKDAGAIVLRHVINRGQGAALKTGSLAALALGADIVVHVDADGQHDPEFLPTLIEPIERGEADVVFGSRFLGVEALDMPPLRRTVLLAGKLFSTYVLGIPYRVTDSQAGLRAVSSAAARRIDFRQDGKAHCSEILRSVTRSDLRWREIPIRVRYTSETLAKGNKTSDAFRIVWELLIGSLRK